MVRRRIKAVFEFGFSVFALCFVLFLRKATADLPEDEEIEPNQPLSLAVLAFGAGTSALSVLLSDHDVCRIRTSRRRRLLFGLLWSGKDRVLTRFASNPGAFRGSLSIGEAVGLVAYRLWYGILHPLPGPDPDSDSVASEA